MWESVGKAYGWKCPGAPSPRLLSQDEGAIPAILTFLRETKVGRVVTLAPPEEEGGEDREQRTPQEVQEERVVEERTGKEKGKPHYSGKTP